MVHILGIKGGILHLNKESQLKANAILKQSWKIPKRKSRGNIWPWAQLESFVFQVKVQTQSDFVVMRNYNLILSRWSDRMTQGPRQETHPVDLTLTRSWQQHFGGRRPCCLSLLSVSLICSHTEMIWLLGNVTQDSARMKEKYREITTIKLNQVWPKAASNTYFNFCLNLLHTQWTVT